jgi:hypothetical protein
MKVHVRRVLQAATTARVAAATGIFPTLFPILALSHLGANTYTFWSNIVRVSVRSAISTPASTATFTCTFDGRFHGR